MRQETTYEAVIKRWRDQAITSEDALNTTLSNFNILFAYNSGVIENPEITYHNTREIFENGKIINFTGDIRTIFEIKNQKDCSEWMTKKIISKELITPELIKLIHFKLTKETYDERRYQRGERPGEYKKHDYVVGNNQGALPEEIPGELEKLCKKLGEVSDDKDKIVETAAYLHCKLENIHPFADGNGRVGRTLMNYFLMLHNYPPLIVRNETKDRYYKALEKYDKTGELNDFIIYIKEEMVETWQTPNMAQKRLKEYIE